MRNKLLAALLLLGGAGLAWGQPGPSSEKPKPGASDPFAAPGKVGKSGLEEALAALKDNPDLRVAVAKLAEAEAQFVRARLQVAQKVVAQYQAAEQARATLQLRAVQLANLRSAVRMAPGAVSKNQVAEAESKLGEAKAALAAADAELAYLQGKAAGRTAMEAPARSADSFWFSMQSFNDRGTVHPPGRSPRPEGAKGAISDKLRKALDRRVSVKFEQAKAPEVLRLIEKEAGGVLIQFVGATVRDGPLTVELKDVPLGAVLQLFEDALGNYRVVVRDYGLLLAPQDRVPPGAVLLSDVWRAAPRPAPAASARPGGRIGLVNLTRVLHDYEKFKALKADVKKITHTAQEQDAKLKTASEELFKQSNTSTTSAARRAELEAELKTLSRRREDLKDALRRDVATKSEEQLKALYKDVEVAARRYASAHGLELILQYHGAADERGARTSPASGCLPLYAAPGVDISREITAILNAGLERKAP